MADTRTKTISYRRAVWLSSGTVKSLATYVSEAHAKLPRVDQRTYTRFDGQTVKCLKIRRDRGGQGIFLHIAAETPGDHASVLPAVRPDDQESDVQTTKPPENTEYMDGDLLLYIKDDHICICATNFSEGSILKYLLYLFEKAKLPNECQMLDLQKIADVKKIKLINAEGVKEIEIKGSLYAATMAYNKRKQKVTGALSAVGKFMNHINKLLYDQPAYEDNMIASLILKTDGRIKVGGSSGKDRLKKFAKAVVEDDDDVQYNILTNSGQRISNTEIFIRKRIDIEKFGKSVNPDKGWKALREYYLDLVNSGVAEQ